MTSDIFGKQIWNREKKKKVLKQIANWKHHKKRKKLQFAISYFQNLVFDYQK